MFWFMSYGFPTPYLPYFIAERDPKSLYPLEASFDELTTDDIEWPALAKLLLLELLSPLCRD